MEWPYQNETNILEEEACDVLVLGGGLSGCFAAIAAAQRGQKVILLEKGAAHRSGAAGSGFDHWEMACTNPGCTVSPEEMVYALEEEQDYYSNAIGHYIEAREGWDRLLDLEKWGGKIRDTDDVFRGAAFRDEKTKLLYAYDYRSRYTLRVWGTTFKPALVREMKRLGVRLFDRTEATSLLIRKDGDVTVGCGAIGMNTRTGRVTAFRARSTVLALSRPARIWLFNADTPGLCEFRPFQSIGSGHAMGWRAGMAFTMMEKSVRGEFSAAGRSFPPYGTGNNHNTWYAATMVDARGVEIPYVDRDGRELKTVAERYLPAPGQKFFLKGGVIDEPKYEWRGPETLPFEELMRRGYRLPFYADLTSMPAEERQAIWGLMVGQEAKTRVPIYENYTQRGFDPEKHLLQSYGTGWQSAAFLDQERQLFGAPGGVMHDWRLETNIRNVFAAGDALYASDCAGHACATGHWAGRQAAGAAEKTALPPLDADLARAEQERLLAPLTVKDGLDWREVNLAASKAMQNYCGGVKCDDLLDQGLALIRSLRSGALSQIACRNPHELVRAHEISDILDVSELILEACLARKCSSAPLFFQRSDSRDDLAEAERAYLVIRREDGRAVVEKKPHRFYGDLAENYEKHAKEDVDHA